MLDAMLAAAQPCGYWYHAVAQHVARLQQQGMWHQMWAEGLVVLRPMQRLCPRFVPRCK